MLKSTSNIILGLVLVREFNLLNGTSVSVPFMTSSHDRQYVGECDGFKVLRLPFRREFDKTRSFSMYFYLPDEKDGLDSLVNKMTSTPGFVDDHSPRWRVEVGDFAILKFKISFGFEASWAFEECDDSHKLYHKACVEIDEEGAEAAAGCFMVPVSYTNYRVDFVADHPFLFLIRAVHPFLFLTRATFTQVDFMSKAEQVRKELNKWASDHTNGLIKDLLPPGSVGSKTVKVYGNALYLKGAWADKFSKSKTKDRDFHLLNDALVSVPLMSSNSHQYVQRCNGFKVLKLPFRQGFDKNGSFSMSFYLPDEKYGLDNLVNKMTSTPGFVNDHNPTCRVEVGDFAIPKFKISFGFNASWALEECVSDALYHKACVEIDEEGAEAAAATAFVLTSCRNTRKGVDFVADHPFLFLSREDTTGTVLFAGQIFDPVQSS